ncbi:MAG: RNA polymerase sigma factor [Bryobacteraceae bacterium]
MAQSSDRTDLPSDSDLLGLMSGGDEVAFTALYRRHQGALYRFALQMSGKIEIAEEVTQEVFMWLMRESRHYKAERGPLIGFLYGVTRNFVLRHLERDRVYTVSMDDLDNEAMNQKVSGEDVLGDLTRGERVELLRQAILSLPAPYREVVVLCDLHELDYAETATVLGCPVGTVRSRLHRARTLLSWKIRASEECPA